MNKVKLGQAVDILDYKRIPVSSAERANREKVYPYYGAQGVVDYIDDYIFDGEYVLVAEDGNNLKSLSEPIATWATGRFWVNNHAHIIGDNGTADIRYVYYYLMASDLRGLITGSAQPKLNQENLASFELELPDRETQVKTAEVLRSIDDKIALNKKMMTELEDTARLIYDYWFTQFDFPDENGKPYRSSGGKMVYDETLNREIPEGWEVGLIGDLGSVVSGATPPTGDSSNYADEGIAWITPNDLSDNDSFMHISRGERDVSDAGLASCSAVVMPAGSTIMSSRAPIGYLAVAETACCTNQGCKSLMADAGYPSYFNFFTVQRLVPFIKSQGVGTTFAEVSKEDFASVRLARPPKGMAERFERSVLPLCEKSKRLQQEAVELSSLRDWLLPMLMNGQVIIDA